MLFGMGGFGVRCLCCVFANNGMVGVEQIDCGWLYLVFWVQEKLWRFGCGLRGVFMFCDEVCYVLILE